MLGTVLLLVGVLSLPGPARADHHFVRISEVFLGTGGHTNVQYVSLRAYSSGQDEFTANDAEIVFYEADGDAIGNGEEFTQDPNPFGDQGQVLIATTAAETFFGVTADLEFPATTGLGTGGAVCFESSSFGRVDCATWGNYAPGVGEPAANTPFSPSEGIPSGAALRRKLGGNDELDSGDDSNNSNADFSLRTPVPIGTAGGGDPSDVPRVVLFAGADATVPEDGGPVFESAGIVVNNDPNSYTAEFSTVPLTATEDDDYGGAQETMDFPANDGSDSTNIAINDDPDLEGSESFRIQLREPTGGAVLGDGMQFRVTIRDPEDDDEKPRSRITRPDQGGSYKRAKLDTIDGRWNDGLGDVDEVFVGLRQKLKNGNCRWLDGDEFVARKCSRKKLLLEHTANNGTWDYELNPLPKSVGTNIRFYTAYSKAKDWAGNAETSFENGRNVIRFDIK
jgi:hypothetical protein